MQKRLCIKIEKDNPLARYTIYQKTRTFDKLEDFNKIIGFQREKLNVYDNSQELPFIIDFDKVIGKKKQVYFNTIQPIFHEQGIIMDISKILN
jgi:uncharacterized FlgJ-related protein